MKLSKDQIEYCQLARRLKTMNPATDPSGVEGLKAAKATTAGRIRKHAGNNFTAKALLAECQLVLDTEAEAVKPEDRQKREQEIDKLKEMGKKRGKQ